jgi:hypothetical protein
MDAVNRLKYVAHHKRILRECERQIEDIRVEEKMNKIRIRNAEAKLESLKASKVKRKKQICDLKKIIEDSEY